MGFNEPDLPNEVGGRETASPEEVQQQIKLLLRYEKSHNKDIVQNVENRKKFF